MGVLLGVLLPRRRKESAENSNLFVDLPESSPWYGDEEIRIFREYLQIPTVHPNINYGKVFFHIATKYIRRLVVTIVSNFLFSEPCVQFLKRQAKSLNLPVSVVYPVDERNPVVIMEWTGLDPNLPSIMLNSHTDVVPVFEEMWSNPPFAAEIDEDGKIFARGTQDTKSLGMIYLAAIRALKSKGVTSLRRTIYITFVPDEETGGSLGMGGFVLTDEFKAMNVGYALDEAGVSPTNEISVYNDERCPWQIEIVSRGPTGHGSILFENTAGEKLSYVVSKLLDMRKMELEKLKTLPYGKVTTINLTVLKGGVQTNVVPPELSAIFDIRLDVDIDHTAFENQVSFKNISDEVYCKKTKNILSFKLNQWCAEAGGDIEVKYAMKTPKAPTSIADSTNPVWVVLQDTTKEL